MKIAFSFLLMIFHVAVFAAELRVGLVGEPPFVTNTAGVYGGYAVDVWSAVAQSLQINSHFIVFQDDETAFEAVENNAVDVLIGSTVLTAAHALHTLPTQPITSNEVAILTSRNTISEWDALKPILQKVSIALIIIVIFSLLLVGVLIWRAERSANASHFPIAPKQGIGDGIWFAIVTMTGVGYGDRVPVTLRGRILTSIWMIIGLVFTSVITGGIVASLTASSQPISKKLSIEELHNKQIAVIAGTPDASIVNGLSAIPITIDTLADAIEQLKQHRVSAILYSRPQLRYYLKEHPGSGFDMLDVMLPYQSIGFLLPEQQLPLFKRINVELLRLKEAGVLQNLQKRWL